MRSERDDVEGLFVQYAASGDRQTRNELIERHRWLAAECARRFCDRGEPFDDLEQVALYGLLRAVERFRPGLGTPFTAFARVTMRGELRRHFRDTTWAVHVPRPAKDLEQRLGPTIDRLTQELGRAPRPAELAAALDETIDRTLEAMQARQAYRTHGLPPVEPAVDGHATRSTDHVLAHALLQTLGPRDRHIVELRFFGGLSQAAIAERVGLSQVQVSRLLRRSLALLRNSSGEADPADVAS